MKFSTYIGLFFILYTSVFANDKNVLKLGFMPYLSSEVLIKKYTPLAQYLSQKTGKNVKIVVAKDYNKHLEDTGNDKLDISFLGGSPYVEITSKYGQKPLLCRYEFNGQPTFSATIFTHKNSKISSLKELKNKSISFGSPKSTLSTQIPLYMLLKNGVTLDNLSSFKHLRNHENVIYSVLLGDSDAGAVASEVFYEKQNQGIKILEQSKELSTHVFVTKKDMDKKLFKTIKNALLNLKDEKILKNISSSLTGFVKVEDKDYDYHREVLKEVLPILERNNR